MGQISQIYIFAIFRPLSKPKLHYRDNIYKLHTRNIKYGPHQELQNAISDLVSAVKEQKL